MTNIEQAIRDAAEKGGYEFSFFAGEMVQKFPDGTFAPAIFAKEFLDPKFWQAHRIATAEKCDHRYPPNGDGTYSDNCKLCGAEFDEVKADDWKERWHRFIDHLADGKDAESFFASLITQSTQ